MDYIKLYEDMLFKGCEPFWTEHTPDKINGGIYTSLDRYGEVYSNDKSVWMQGRCLWTYSALINHFGAQPEWLNIAQSCLDFLNSHCMDADGHMFFTVTDDGRPLRKRRYWYSEAFYVMGCAEYSLATGNKKALADARQKYTFIRKIYDDPSSDPYKLPPKTYPSTRATKPFAYPMVLLNAAHVLRRCDLEHAEEYMCDASRFADEIVRDFYHEDLHLVLEQVGPDGSLISGSAATRVVNPGHAIEGSWFLMNQAAFTGKDKLMKTAIQIFDDSIEMGWDKEYGGIFYFMDALGKPMVELEADMKLWWPICESLIASLTAYRVTKKTRYWQWFEKLTGYALTHFRDREGGEWYGYLHRNGSVSHTYKGSMFKGPFHVERALMFCIDLLNEIPYPL